MLIELVFMIDFDGDDDINDECSISFDVIGLLLLLLVLILEINYEYY
jgi:hypothetical protein